jgi:pyrimidine-nucleoside phosphorylase
MNVVELIRKKREGDPLTEEELRFLITGYVEGRIPDYQMAAFFMACYFRSMSDEETLTFAELMLHSGEVIDLSHIPGVKVDKHSTGGVGDKVSLILAPVVAACGVPVPMISGRGLGHTGGTLDKLESIPGFRTNLSVAEYKRTIEDIGLVMIGQTEEIAPADRKMYALRDVTATVECIPLIAASIMSKKMAEGIDALVLDVKTGRGAFMQTYEHALQLAITMVGIGKHFGKETLGLITNMDQPLGSTVGNWLEVVESVECLRNERGTDDHSSDLMEVTHALAGAMLMLGKKCSTIREGIAMSQAAIENGRAYETFLNLVKKQGGNPKTIEQLESYPRSSFALDVNASDEGYIIGIDAFEVGRCSIMLGAGREQLNDRIDPKAGIILRGKVGERVSLGSTLATIHTDREEMLGPVRSRLRRAFRIHPSEPDRLHMILNVVTDEGIDPWM